MAQEQWPATLPVIRARVARPTDRLDEVVRFYQEGVGLPFIERFEGAGYTGVLLGLPDVTYHLEFTQHVDGSPCPAPSRDNLLVLYMQEREAMDRVVERLACMGFPSVPPENPYWSPDRSVTVEDPDGWRVVFMQIK